MSRLLSRTGMRRPTIRQTSNSPAIEHSQNAMPSGCAPPVAATLASEKDRPHVEPITMSTDHAQTKILGSWDAASRDVSSAKTLSLAVASPFWIVANREWLRSLQMGGQAKPFFLSFG